MLLLGLLCLAGTLGLAVRDYALEERRLRVMAASEEVKKLI